MAATQALSRGGWRIVALLLALALGACTFPADSRDTLERVRGGTLVVGVSEHEPWTSVDDSGAVSGSEVDLVTAFADSLDATVEWHVGPESVLAEEIGHGRLDVVIGGLTTKSPWSSKMALTRPYTESTDADGARIKMVMGTHLGENALLVALERHLAAAHGEL